MWGLCVLQKVLNTYHKHYMTAYKEWMIGLLNLDSVFYFTSLKVFLTFFSFCVEFEYIF